MSKGMAAERPDLVIVPGGCSPRPLMPMSYDGADLVIRGGRIVTEPSVFEADLAILHGRIAAIGGRSSIDADELLARGRLFVSVIVDTHCDVDQKSPSGTETAAYDRCPEAMDQSRHELLLTGLTQARNTAACHPNPIGLA